MVAGRLVSWPALKRQRSWEKNNPDKFAVQSEKKDFRGQNLSGLCLIYRDDAKNFLAQKREIFFEKAASCAGSSRELVPALHPTLERANTSARQSLSRHDRKCSSGLGPGTNATTASGQKKTQAGSPSRAFRVGCGRDQPGLYTMDRNRPRIPERRAKFFARRWALFYRYAASMA